jgi:formylglycine-generating enzyme required for sulfatase activity
MESGSNGAWSERKCNQTGESKVKCLFVIAVAVLIWSEAVLATNLEIAQDKLEEILAELENSNSALSQDLNVSIGPIRRNAIASSYQIVLDNLDDIYTNDPNLIDQFVVLFPADGEEVSGEQLRQMVSAYKEVALAAFSLVGGPVVTASGYITGKIYDYVFDYVMSLYDDLLVELNELTYVSTQFFSNGAPNFHQIAMNSPLGESLSHSVNGPAADSFDDVPLVSNGPSFPRVALDLITNCSTGIVECDGNGDNFGLIVVFENYEMGQDEDEIEKVGISLFCEDENGTDFSLAFQGVWDSGVLSDYDVNRNTTLRIASIPGYAFEGINLDNITVRVGVKKRNGVNHYIDARETLPLILEKDNMPGPYLTNGRVESPSQIHENETVAYKVDYKAIDEDPPGSTVELVLDGTSHALFYESGNFNPFATFSRIFTNASPGVYNYYFSVDVNGRSYRDPGVGLYTIEVLPEPTVPEALSLDLEPASIYIGENTTVNVQVENEFGNPLNGVVVQFSSSQISGTWTGGSGPAQATTNQLGQAAIHFAPSSNGNTSISACPVGYCPVVFASQILTVSTGIPGSDVELRQMQVEESPITPGTNLEFSFNIKNNGVALDELVVQYRILDQAGNYQSLFPSEQEDFGPVTAGQILPTANRNLGTLSSMSGFYQLEVKALIPGDENQSDNTLRATVFIGEGDAYQAWAEREDFLVVTGAPAFVFGDNNEYSLFVSSAGEYSARIVISSSSMRVDASRSIDVGRGMANLFLGGQLLLEYAGRFDNETGWKWAQGTNAITVDPHSVAGIPGQPAFVHIVNSSNNSVNPELEIESFSNFPDGEIVENWSLSIVNEVTPNQFDYRISIPSGAVRRQYEFWTRLYNPGVLQDYFFKLRLQVSDPPATCSASYSTTALVVTPDQAGMMSVTLTPQFGFSEPVLLQFAGLPEGVLPLIANNNQVPPVTMEVQFVLNGEMCSTIAPVTAHLVSESWQDSQELELAIEAELGEIGALQAEWHDGQLLLQWPHVYNASSYKVYRSMVPYFDLAQAEEIAEVTGTTWSLVPDSTVDGQYFQIKAVGCTGTSGVPDMVHIPVGQFMMGQTGVATPEHSVTLTHDFLLGRTEVTNAQYLDALQWAWDQGMLSISGDYVRQHGQNLLRINESGYDLYEIRINSSTQQFYLQAATHDFGSYGPGEAYPGGSYDPAFQPVKHVTWFGAACFCDWLSQRDGLSPYYSGTWNEIPGTRSPYTATGYRLPTEAEWEFAAQHDDERTYPWGSASPTCALANFNPLPHCLGWASPVGSHPSGANSLELQDLAGNVWEWCNDWSAGYSSSSQENPAGPVTGSTRVIRGGSWDGGDVYLSCAKRSSTAPSDINRRYGFRLCKTAASTEPGLEAYYPFNGSAQDASGNGHDGTVSGALELTSDRFGNQNSAYEFNGTNSYITVPHHADLVLDRNLSLSVWFKRDIPSVHGFHQRFLSKWEIGSNPARHEYVLGLDYQSSNHVWGAVGHWQNSTESSDAPDAQWHHAVFTSDDTGVFLYLDGVLESQGPHSTAHTTGSFNPLFIGGGASSSPMPVYIFDGRLDDIRIYNRAITAQEVLNLYHEGGWMVNP